MTKQTIFTWTAILISHLELSIQNSSFLPKLIIVLKDNKQERPTINTSSSDGIL